MAKKTKTGSSKNRHLMLIIVLIVLVIMTVTAVVSAGVLIFSKTTKDYREKILESASKLAAEHIDGNKVDEWFENGVDEEYGKTAKILESILNNTPYLQYLYVYKIEKDGCHVVFDFETTSGGDLTEYDELPDVDAGNFGKIVEFDESFSEYLPTLIAGGRLDNTIESNDTYGWLITRYEPVYDDSGKCVCYVGTDISMFGINDYVKSYLIQVLIIAGIFFAIYVFIGIRISVDVRRADEVDALVNQQKRDKDLLREII